MWRSFRRRRHSGPSRVSRSAFHVDLRPALVLLIAACAPTPPADVVADPRPARFLYASERPGGATDDPMARARDVTGRSVKTPRVRAQQADEPGGTVWLLREDPWLAYARGRELFLREFSAADGAYGEAGRLAGPTLDDGATRLMARDHTNSCVMCHNVPWRDGGAGATIAKNSGAGRNTPHLFGAGLIEMLGAELRLRLLALVDENRDGWVSVAEAAGRRAVLEDPEGTFDAGRFDDARGDGRPDLNAVCAIWYVDAAGERIAWARSLRDPGVAGYGFEVQVFGHGQRARVSEGGIASTLRAFSATAFDVHAGLTPCDDVLNAEPRRDGLAGVSPAGAQQFATGVTRDRGQRRDAAGRSLDDPDRDRVLEEITAGDLDLIEWYQLNHPRPAERPHPAGRAAFESIGCTACHRPDWRLEAARESDDYTHRRTGDRRVFDIDVDVVDGQARGRLRRVDRGAAITVRGIYSDFLHHDLGPAFHETQFDGSRITRFRTAPLWGVGSTAPYGHDGASLDLDHAIRRHGGEAAPVTARYVALPDPDREALLAFLRGLVLYATDTLACDVDGDGAIAARFVVAGVDTGIERFNPEWLFRVPGRIEGSIISVTGERLVSQALTNVDAAYGCDLPLLADRDGDGWPDRPAGRSAGR